MPRRGEAALRETRGRAGVGRRRGGFRSRGIAAAGLFLLLAAPGGAPAAARARPGQRLSRDQMQVRVDLVGVVTSVLDAAGKPVANLPREAFRVFENGKRQRIDLFQRQTNLPLDLALMIDTSLSTYSEMKFEREAAAGFLQQVLRPGDRLAIFTFSSDVSQLSPFTADTRTLEGALKRIHEGSGTSLFDAIFLGSHALARLPANRRRVLLLVTDAGETTSSTSYDAARDAAVRAGAMLYTILIRPIKREIGRNTGGEHALDTIIDQTGGALYTVDTPDQFAPTFSRINEELRTEYLLGYYPDPLPPPGSYRTIEVQVTPATPAAGYAVRYRKGYFTPKASQ
jgi:Ca-activated chloride channel family protein